MPGTYNGGGTIIGPGRHFSDHKAFPVPEQPSSDGAAERKKGPKSAAAKAAKKDRLAKQRALKAQGPAPQAPEVVAKRLSRRMVVCCETERGTVVLASDAAHLYANLTRRIPFPIFVDEADYVRAAKRVMELAGGSLDHIIPGHDPLVLECYPTKNNIARVDLPPLVPIASTQ